MTLGVQRGYIKRSFFITIYRKYYILGNNYYVGVRQNCEKLQLIIDTYEQPHISIFQKR